MCVPALAAIPLMGQISMGISAVSGLFSAYSANQQGKYQASIAEHNANVSRQRAFDAIAQGAVEEQRIGLKAASIVGQQRASYASRGVLVDTGTPLAQQAETMDLAKTDMTIARDNAARNAWGFMQESAGYRAEASAARSAGKMSAFGSLLTAATNVASKWYDYAQET